MSSLPESDTFRIYLVVLSVGVVCSLAIATTYEFTRPIINRNKIAARGEAILEVLPGTSNSEAFRYEEPGRFQLTSPDAEGSDLVFAGFDSAGALVGIVIVTQAMGYQDTIRLAYGYSPAKQAIIGIRVLESRETPGLGDRMETDAVFLQNFKHLDVQLNSAGTQLAHPIEFVKAGEKTSDWQIDGITGATISTRAVAAMLRDSAATWIPRVQPRVSEFQPRQGSP
jgi:electron transport complex protein RnfG